MASIKVGNYIKIISMKVETPYNVKIGRVIHIDDTRLIYRT